jgi:Y_Y_Y domain
MASGPALYAAIMSGICSLKELLAFTFAPFGRGSLWLAGVGGIFRVERQALDDMADGKAKTFTTERFGIAEGMRATVAAAIYQPAACVMRDGRLWFTTSDGVVVVDPTHLRRNGLPPPVVIEALVADGESLALASSPHVPAGAAQVAISYNGLSLVVPRRVRFKYKLEGYDTSWVETEGRRVAYYTKLPPGHYRFQVIAANNDGIWNEVGAALELLQRPHFYQTRWFLALCVLALLSVVEGAYRYRERRHRQVEAELEVRVQEALARIKILSGMLPICAWCKRVRDDSGYWSQIESYIAEHSDANFTHGICPDCQSHSRETA